MTKNARVDHLTVNSADHPERIIAEQNHKISLLEKKLEKYEAIFQGLSDGILLIDDKLTECNKEACQIWRCEKEDIIGFFPSDFAPLLQPDGGKSYEIAQAKISEALRGNIQKFEWKDIRRDGIAIDTEVTLSKIDVDEKKLCSRNIQRHYRHKNKRE